MLCDDEALYLRFGVQDRYVLTTRTEYNSDVCKDACVEFFTQPKPDRGYLNFEMNSAGTLHLGYHELPEEGPGRAPVHLPVEESLAKRIQIQSSLPHLVPDEIAEPVEWSLAMRIPLSVIEELVGTLTPLAGSVWRANFYKCASQCSHPHWASWAPIGEKLDFHQPEFFADLRFAKP